VVLRCSTLVLLIVLQWLTNLSDMTTVTNSRDFVRSFARLKKAAANGTLIQVRDRSGATFLFSLESNPPSLGSQLQDLCGALNTGVRVKSMTGFSRKSK